MKKTIPKVGRWNENLTSDCMKNNYEDKSGT